MQTNGSRSAIYWIFMVILVCALGLSVAINAGLSAYVLAHKGAHMEEGGEDEFPEFTETWSYGEGETKALRIPLTGLIMREASTGGLFGDTFDPVEQVLLQIRAAQNDDDVGAIILEVDSPGGAVTPTDEIHDALTKFKNSRDGRVVIAFVRDMAASGGYYAAVAADWIIAEPTAILGSIGVIMQTYNVKGLADKIGFTDVTIKSGDNKDLLNPFQTPDPEDIALIQTTVDAMYQRFFEIVRSARGLQVEQLKPLADGRILTAAEAQKSGLIDEVGFWEDAMAAVKRQMEVEDIKVIRYDRELSLRDLLMQIRSPFQMPKLLSADTPRWLYLWKP